MLMHNYKSFTLELNVQRRLISGRLKKLCFFLVLTLVGFFFFTTGWRRCGQRWLWRHRSTEDRKWWHLHAHLFQLVTLPTPSFGFSFYCKSRSLLHFGMKIYLFFVNNYKMSNIDSLSRRCQLLFLCAFYISVSITFASCLKGCYAATASVASWKLEIPLPLAVQANC